MPCPSSAGMPILGSAGMSEYQYYEFQAIDRPLTEREMLGLRTHSTRAQITPTSFVNEYSWGSLKGDEDAWMERYFDAFLYLANWGTHVLKLRDGAGRLASLISVRSELARGDLRALYLGWVPRLGGHPAL